MKKSKFYPPSQPAQIVWHTTFANEIKIIGPNIDLTPAQIAATVADNLWMIYLLQAWLPSTRNWSTTGTIAMTEAQTGDGSSLMVLPVYVAPALPDGAAPVNTGALNRIFALVQDIKNDGKCSDKDALALGIVGSEQPGPDWTSLQPVFPVSIIGGQVNIKWNWGGYSDFLDACEIQVDRGDGKGFVLLTVDTTPGYTDTQPFPAAKTVWTYRAIYQVDDARVGVWSQSVSIAVQA
jgi:hypothetical protein